MTIRVVQRTTGNVGQCTVRAVTAHPNLDEIVCEVEYAQTTEDLDLGSWTIDAGCVAGIDARWQGRIGGRTIVEMRGRWKKGQTLEPDWPISDVYVVRVDGRPAITTRIEILPPPDFEARTFTDFIVLGMIMTATPAVNAIPRVVAAPPGIVTYVDSPSLAASVS